jgi:hypothetical protein
LHFADFLAHLHQRVGGRLQPARDLALRFAGQLAARCDAGLQFLANLPELLRDGLHHLIELRVHALRLRHERGLQFLARRRDLFLGAASGAGGPHHRRDNRNYNRARCNPNQHAHSGSPSFSCCVRTTSLPANRTLRRKGPRVRLKHCIAICLNRQFIAPIVARAAARDWRLPLMREKTATFLRRLCFRPSSRSKGSQRRPINGNP